MVCKLGDTPALFDSQIDYERFQLPAHRRLDFCFLKIFKYFYMSFPYKVMPILLSIEPGNLFQYLQKQVFSLITPQAIC